MQTDLKNKDQPPPPLGEDLGMKYRLGHVFCFIAVSLLFTARPCFAELSFLELKGMEDNVQLKPEYQYLSPIRTFELLKQPLLTNIYRFGTVGIPPTTATPENPKPINNLDSTTLFIKTIFTMPPGSADSTHFNVSPLSKNIARFLGPATLGDILQFIIEHQKEIRETPTDPKMAQLLSSTIENSPDFNIRIQEAEKSSLLIKKKLDLYDSQLADLNKSLGLANNNFTKLQSQKNHLHFQKKSCALPSETDPLNQLETLTAQIAELELRIPLSKKELLNLEKAKIELLKNSEYLSLKSKLNDSTYKKSHLEKFINLLLSSIHDEEKQNFPYPKHFTEQLLTAIAWKNTGETDKQDFLRMFQKIGHTLRYPEKLNQDWVRNKYSSEDYYNLEKYLEILPTDKQISFLLNNLEKSAILNYGRPFLNSEYLSPDLSIRDVSYNHPELGPVCYRDCSDSAVLDFFLKVLRNPNTGQFDPTLLKSSHETQKASLTLKPEFLEFFSKYSTPTELNTTASRKAWAEIISRRPELQYISEDYELHGDISNLIAATDLIFYDQKSPSDSLFKGLKTKKEKLNQLTHLFSRENFKLGWSPLYENRLEKDRSDQQINFSINGENAFAWEQMSEGHTDIKTQKKQADFNYLIKPLLNKLITGNESLESPEMRTANWLITNPSKTEEFTANLSNKAKIKLRYSLPLVEPRDISALAKLLISENELQNFVPINQLLSEIASSDDIYVQIPAADCILRTKHPENFKKYENYFDLAMTNTLRALERLEGEKLTADELSEVTKDLIVHVVNTESPKVLKALLKYNKNIKLDRLGMEGIDSIRFTKLTQYLNEELSDAPIDHLDLSYNELTVPSAKNILKLIKSNHKIASINLGDLSKSPVQSYPQEAIQAIRENGQFKEVIIANNASGTLSVPLFCKEIAQLIRESTSLIYADFGWACPKDREILDALKHTQIQKVHFNW